MNITIEMNTQEALTALQAGTLEALIDSINNGQETEGTIKREAPSKTETKAAPTTTTKKTAKPKVEKAPEPEDEPTPELEADTEEIPVETVRAALGNLMKAGKKAEVKALLAEFGVTKLADIDPEDYGVVLEKAAQI